MPRVFTVTFSAVSVSASQDLFEITAAAGKPLRILKLKLHQTSDKQDAEEEILTLAVKTGATSSGSGGTAPTPQPVKGSIGAASFTAEVNNTTKASGGTIVTKDIDGWNVRAPFSYPWTPETTIEVAGGERATVELVSTPADALTMSGTLYVEEIG